MKARLFHAAVLILALGAFENAGKKPVIAASLEEVLPPGGEPALLVFFSVECQPCFDDLFEMIVHVERENLPVQVIGISDDPVDDLEAFAVKYSVRCPLVRDTRSRLKRRFRADSFPYKVILSKESVLYRDDTRLEFKERRRQAEKCLADIFSK
jgi:peroxiredoxin